MIIVALKTLIIDKSEDYAITVFLLIFGFLAVFQDYSFLKRDSKKEKRTFSIMDIIGPIVSFSLIAALSYFTDMPRSYIFLGIILLVGIWAIFFSNDKDS